MKNKKEPRIIIWDLETLPDAEIIYDNIPSIGAWPGRTFKAELQSILCFGYKVYGEKKTHCLNAWDFPGYRKDIHNDKQIVMAAKEILMSADAIVTHNGKSFDFKVINTRLAKHNLQPIPPIKHIDTKNVLKSKLSLYSNSLAQAAKFLGLTDKMGISNKWSMWKRFAFNRDTASDRKIMAKYCKQDVDTLEELFIKIRPHAPAIPNYALFNDKDELMCGTCGSTNLQKKGLLTTKSKKLQRYICKDCGAQKSGEVVE